LLREFKVGSGSFEYIMLRVLGLGGYLGANEMLVSRKFFQSIYQDIIPAAIISMEHIGRPPTGG
jgi:hypothetical protein